MTSLVITEAEYAIMKHRLALLEALESYGVDNWDGYDEATKEWGKKDALNRAIDAALSALSDVMTEAEVDYPAGREAGARIVYDDDQIRVILQNLLAQAEDAK
jgi:hypothetical protein